MYKNPCTSPYPYTGWMHQILPCETTNTDSSNVWSYKENIFLPHDLKNKYRTRKKQTISISKFGLISLSLPIYIKYAIAEHGSVAGQDVSVGGRYYKKSSKSSIKPEDIPSLDDSFE